MADLMVAETPADPYCYCADGKGRPHVHCPWGGMHLHLIDEDAPGHVGLLAPE